MASTPKHDEPDALLGDVSVFWWGVTTLRKEMESLKELLDSLE